MLPSLKASQGVNRRRNVSEFTGGQEGNRPLKRLKFMLKNQHRCNKEREGRRNNGNIDSYFDLSCLNGVKLKNKEKGVGRNR